MAENRTQYKDMEPKAVVYKGAEGPVMGWLASDILRRYEQVIVVCRDLKRLEELRADLLFFDNSADVCSFMPWDTLPLEGLSPSKDISAGRLDALFRITGRKSFLCLTTPEALTQKFLPFNLLSALSFKLNLNAPYEFDAICQRFRDCSYYQVPVVEEVGEIAIRGRVIDFYPFAAPYPVRAEFSGSSIDKLRYFDPDTQRSLQDISEIEVFPVREIIPMGSLASDAQTAQLRIEKIKSRAKAIEVPPSEVSAALSGIKENVDLPGIELLQIAGYSELSSLLELSSSRVNVIIEDGLQLEERLEGFGKRVGEHAEILRQEHRFFPDPEHLYVSTAQLLNDLEVFPRHYVDHLGMDFRHEENGKSGPTVVNLKSASNLKLQTKLKTLVGSGKALKPMQQQINAWRRDGYRIAFVVGTEGRAQRLQRALLDIGMDAPVKGMSGLDWAEADNKLPFVILLGQLSEGFSLASQKLIFISENEVFPEKSYRKSRESKMSMRRILNSLSQLSVDDFIVHADFGVGIYRGLKHLEIEGVQGDFLHIEYADSKLYLPVHNIGKVQKFYAGDNQVPVIDKLSSSRWSKTKLKVKQALVELAGDLIRLYAERHVSTGWRFEPYGAEDERFADGFPFNETPDQMRSVREVLADMASDKPMDRLVCGDVGFGKTEVALRAAFKCTQHTRQVAVLVPTTILVEQHYKTFSQRFSDFPVKVGAVSRFYTSDDNKHRLQELASGELDIIIGTHRLLSKDVQFKDLGLLIIDEEHRFGVKQKERLKQLKKDVDVLSMTATPIPRTLYMSLLDIRDASLITTAPHDRKVTRSYVATYGEGIVRDAILREIQRGGQCFYLHNRVQSIGGVTARLKELVPEARFEFAHGQMSEVQLENIMQRFMKGEINVLVSTTIIESGLDIPNANTIIIERADMFGLAQLYQLRGRVGRSNKQAYAYFLVPKAGKLGAEAQQRLKVLQSLDDLGAGFNLAIRDLEIRGAGNLLGKEQSGNVLAVGFELYTKILKEAVLHVKGQDLPAFEVVDPEMKMRLPAFIPEFYIPDISERLLLYQRLSMITSSQEADEMISEIEDRFGVLPQEVQSLVEVMRLRGLLRYYAVAKAEVGQGKFLISFTAHSPVDIGMIVSLVKSKPKSYALSKNQVFSIALSDQETVHQPAAVATIYKKVKQILSEVSKEQVNF